VPLVGEVNANFCGHGEAIIIIIITVLVKLESSLYSFSKIETIFWRWKPS
jgi:hypothetical protein